jgi:hypothetical protein
VFRPRASAQRRGLPAAPDHLQIASWLRQQPGVLTTRVVGTGRNEAFVIVHPTTLTNETRKRITDRLVWFDVRFEQDEPRYSS